MHGNEHGGCMRRTCTQLLQAWHALMNALRLSEQDNSVHVVAWPPFCQHDDFMTQQLCLQHALQVRISCIILTIVSPCLQVLGLHHVTPVGQSLEEARQKRAIPICCKSQPSAAMASSAGAPEAESSIPQSPTASCSTHPARTS